MDPHTGLAGALHRHPAQSIQLRVGENATLGFNSRLRRRIESRLRSLFDTCSTTGAGLPKPVCADNRRNSVALNPNSAAARVSSTSMGLCESLISSSPQRVAPRATLASELPGPLLDPLFDPLFAGG